MLYYCITWYVYLGITKYFIVYILVYRSTIQYIVVYQHNDCIFKV